MSLKDSSPRHAGGVGGASPPATRTTGPIRGAELVCDVNLAALALASEAERYVGLLLMRVQNRTWMDRRHLLDLSCRDAVTMLGNVRTYRRVATIIIRCTRCGCIALLSDWIAAVDDPEYPLVVDRRFHHSTARLVDTKFLQPCEGNRIFLEALSLLE